MKTDAELIYRYLKMKPEADPAARVADVCGKMERALTPGYVFRLFPISEEKKGISLADTGVILTGGSARRLLKGCRSAALLTVTLGFAFDKLLMTAQKRDMSEAVILDACASAYIETVADEAMQAIRKASNGYLTDRFSPGYGDMPLSLQPQIIRLTEAEKRLGVHALDSCLLNPVKSVTAVIGISDTPRPAMIRGCAYCALNSSCPYKKGTGNCEAE